MDGEVLESFDPANVGKMLSNFADNTGSPSCGTSSPTTSHRRRDQVRERALCRSAGHRSGIWPATGQYSQPVPSYTVDDLFASYVSPNLEARLNVGNVTDEDYYLAAYRSGSFLYMGDARNCA